MRGFKVAAASIALGGAMACGSDGGVHFGDGGSTDAESTEGSLGDSGLVFGDSSTPDTGPVTDPDAGACPPAATMIYVTGQPAELWSFWPPTFTFTKIGNLSCTSSPTHMTVDRNANAWVVASGNVYKTSTKNASCSLLSTWKSQTNFGDFAVAMVGITSADTTLYLLGSSSLGKFDIALGTFNVIGTPSAGSLLGDMTSNGDGNLYFLEAYITPHPLYQINPTNAKVTKTYDVNATGVGSQALAYFGGRFYAFENNIVYEYDPLLNTVKTLGTAPLTVTGAGQSTCVPQTPQDGGPPVN